MVDTSRVCGALRPGVHGKVEDRWVGPFTVLSAVRSNLAYRIDLPECVRMHPVIHVSYLRPYIEPDTCVRSDASCDTYLHEGNIVPECIMARRVHNECVEYRVLWSGDSDDEEEQTWESEAFCKSRCPHLVKQFESLPKATPVT